MESIDHQGTTPDRSVGVGIFAALDLEAGSDDGDVPDMSVPPTNSSAVAHHTGSSQSEGRRGRVRPRLINATAGGEPILQEVQEFVPHGDPSPLGRIVAASVIFVLAFVCTLGLWWAMPRRKSELHPDLGGTGGLPVFNLEKAFQGIEDYTRARAEGSDKGESQGGGPGGPHPRMATLGGHVRDRDDLVSLSVPQPRGNYPQWLRMHARLVEEATEATDAKVVFMGDSITESMLGTHIGVDCGRSGDPPEALRAVWQKHYEPMKALNLGVAADGVDHLLWRLQNGELPDPLQPRVALVMIGTNNIQREAGDIVEGVRAVVDYVLGQREGASMVLMGLLPRDDRGTRFQQHVEDTNWGLEELAKERDRVTYLDCSDRFFTKPMAAMGDQPASTDGQLDESLLGDRLHPNAAGLELWAQCMDPVIAELLQNK